MGAAAADGDMVYVVSSNKVFRLSLGDSSSGWQEVATVPGPARNQHVAAIQNGDQKEKMLVVFGGYDVKTKQPLRDGYGLVLSRVGASGTSGTAETSGTDGLWKKLSPLLRMK